MLLTVQAEAETDRSLLCQPNGQRRVNRGVWALLLGCWLATGFANLGGYRPLTTHEVLVAQSAREMLAENQWLIPRCFGEVRLRKPPLAYWLVMVAYLTTGQVTEWTARLPSVVSGGLLVLAVTLLASRLFGRSSGWNAGFITLTSVYFVQQSRLAEADITMAAMVATAIAAYALAGRTQGPSRWHGIVFWSASGLAVLAKGPIGLAMVAVTVIGHTLLIHGCQTSGRKRLHPTGARQRLFWSPFGWALFGFFCLAWPIAVCLAQPQAWHIWHNETIGRFLEDPNGVERYPFYYLFAALWLTLPWTPLWLAQLWSIRRRMLASPKLLLCLCWLVLPLLLLSLSSGKQEHYLIPALPACSMLAGISLTRLQRRWRNKPLVRCGPVAIVLAIVVCQYTLLPRIHGKREAVDWLVQQVRNVPDEKMVCLGHSVHWLVFYVPQSMQRFDSLEEFFRTSNQSPHPRWVLAPLGTLADLQARGEVTQLEICPEVTGLSDYKRPVLLRYR